MKIDNNHERMERDSSDNTDLDLQIAEVLELTVDQVEEIPLETVELLREFLWRLPSEPMRKEMMDNITKNTTYGGEK